MGDLILKNRKEGELSKWHLRAQCPKGPGVLFSARMLTMLQTVWGETEGTAEVLIGISVEMLSGSSLAAEVIAVLNN